MKIKILNFLEKVEELKTGKIYLDISKITKKELEMLKQEKYNLKDYRHYLYNKNTIWILYQNG